MCFLEYELIGILISFQNSYTELLELGQWD